MQRISFAALAIAALLAALAPAALAAPPVDVSGTWNVHSSGCGCTFQETYAMDPSGNVTGTGPEPGWTVTGRVSGYTFEYTDHYAGSYESHVTVTVSGDGSSYTGAFHDSNGSEGEIRGTHLSGGGKEAEGEKAGGAHASAMAVSCDLDELTLQDTCTATVADTAAVSPTGPTGTVTFSAPGGFFPFGKACTLHSSPSAPSTSFCSVEYAPGSGSGFPNVSASYPGDSTHGAAGGSTRFVVPGGEPAGYEESGPGSGYPSELTVEVKTPAPKTEVQAGVDKGETKPPAPPGKHLRALEDPDIIPEMREAAAEREREERYPDVIPEMRKEVEEREIQYEKDLREMRTEINAMERKRAGLNTQATEELTRLLQDDNTLAKQMAEQIASPGLKRDPASQPVLEKLTKQSNELQKEVGEVLNIQHRQVEGVLRAAPSSLASWIASTARSGKRHAAKPRPTGQLVELGRSRVVAGGAGAVKLRLHLNKALLRRLAHGRKSVKLNLRILMVVPSRVFKTGLPLGTLRTITVHAGRRTSAGKS